MENSSAVWEFPNCEFKEAKAPNLGKKAKSLKSSLPSARGVLSSLSITAPADSSNALNIMKATAQATKSQPSLDKKMSKKGKAQCKADQGNKKSDDKETLFLVNWINYTFDRMQLISTDNFNGDETMDNMSFNASVMSMNQKMLCQEYAYGIKQVFENESDETIRKAGYELYSSENVLGVIKKVEKAVERGLFLIREDREVELDLGLQESFFELLFSYDLTYLTLGVQIIFTEKLSSGSKNKRKLRSLIKSTIIAKLFKVEIEVGEIFKKSNSLKAIDKKKKELLNQHIIKKFLSLVLFLDQSRLSAVLTKGTLFEKNSIFKSSKDIITNFCTLCLKAEGDIIKHLGNLGYSVSFTQSYLDEFDFKVTDLRTDLKDGVRLTRLFELLVGAEESRNNELSSQLRVPAISRLQKIHNNKVILDMLMTTTPSESETMSKKIADGDVESILVVLWKMLFQFELQGDSDDADKNNNNKNKKNGFLTKEEIRKEIAILQKEIRSKLDFSSPVEEVESGDFASLLLTWIQLVVEPYGLPVYDLTQSLADGSLLSFVINYYHPSLLPLAAIKEVPGDDGHASTQHVQYTKEEREGFSKRESHNWKCIKLAAKAIGGIPTMILGEQVSTRNPPNEENMLIFLARFFMRLTASATQIRAVLVLQRWCRVHFLGREGGASKKREVTVRQHASSRFRRWQQRRQEGQPVAGGDSSSFALGQVKVGSKQESRFAQWKRANNLGDNVNTSKSPKLILKTTNSTISDATEQEEEEEGEGEEEGEEQGSDENSPVPQSLVDDINDDDGDIQPIQPPRPPSQEEEDEDQARLDISAVLAVRRVDVNGKGGGRDDEQHQLDDLLGLLSDDEEDEAAAVLVEQEQEAEEEAGQQRQALLLEVERSAAEALAKQRQQQEEEEQEVAAIALANRLAEEAVAEEEEKQRRVETQAILLQKQQLEEEEATAALAAEALAKQQQLALALQLEKEQAEAAALELAKAEAEAAAEAIAIQSEVSSLLADMTHGIISICQASVLNMATEIVDSLVTISVDEAEILRQRRLFEAELHYQFELQLEEERVREESRRMALHKYELLLQKCAMIITRCFQEHVARIKTRKMRVLKLKFEQEECETAAAIRLQSHFRRLRAQKKFRCAILAVSILQAMHRKKSILRTFKLMYSAATQIASCVRGYLVRKACANMKIMIFESQVLRGKQQLAQTVIGSSVMIYLKHKRRVAVAVKTQKLIRAKMLVWRVRNMVAGFRKLMALYRGYYVRKHAKKNIRAMLLRLRQARLRWSEGGPLTLGQKTAAALATLQSAKTVSAAIKACQILQVSTQYSRDSCEKFVFTNSAVILLQLIQSCNRSTPHQELLRLALVVLLNVARYPALAAYIGNHTNDSSTALATASPSPSPSPPPPPPATTVCCCEVLVDLLQMFRDKATVFALAAHLLTIIVHASDSSKAMLASSGHGNHHRKRLDGIAQILERKHRIYSKCKDASLGVASPPPAAAGKTKNGGSSPKQREDMYRGLDARTCLSNLIAALK